MHRLVVLISGNGSNLQAIIDAIVEQRLKGTEIVHVFSNRSNAYGLERARQASINTTTFPLKLYRDQQKTREEYDADLAKLIVGQKPDLVVLAGWMHILSSAFLERVQVPVINLHPALPGAFDGARAIERAFEAFQQGQIEHTGKLNMNMIKMFQ
jgi:formyltetrahydrofolate-dependent phosphoribosylglycinamide formyltransferase